MNLDEYDRLKARESRAAIVQRKKRNKKVRLIFDRLSAIILICGFAYAVMITLRMF